MPRGAADRCRPEPAHVLMGGQSARRLVGQLGEAASAAGVIQRSLGVVEQAGGKRQPLQTSCLGGRERLPERAKSVAGRPDIGAADGDAGAVPLGWKLRLGQCRVDLRHQTPATGQRLELARACLQCRRARGVNAAGQLAIELELVHPRPSAPAQRTCARGVAVQDAQLHDPTSDCHIKHGLRQLVAAWLRSVAAGPKIPSAVRYHAHLEHYPAHPWLAADSEPVVVTLSG